MTVHSLFVWDFDNTVVLDNTDTLVFQKLAPKVLARQRAIICKSAGPHLWTTIISNGLMSLFEMGKTPEEILSAAADAFLPVETAAVLRRIASTPTARSVVLSDANTLFIHACLKKADLPHDQVFEGGIFTNPATVEEPGFISLRPFIDPNDPEKQHKCNRCAANLCKGEVLQRIIRDEYDSWRIVYVGDGGNDHCPVLRMGSEGVVLARKGFPLHRKVLERPPLAEVRLWDSPVELKGLIDDLL